jgi:threonylcarbamoyladenosine tRNA methylthiotransferase MtaB
VGFPGETEELFEQNFNFLHELPISYLHVFTYSERPNTPSINFAGRVEPRIRFSHSERLRNLGFMKKSAFYQSMIGKIRPVLIENSIENNMLQGFTDNYVRVQIPYHPSLENSIAKVKIGEFSGEVCNAEIVSIEAKGVPINISIPIVQ